MQRDQPLGEWLLRVILRYRPLRATGGRFRIPGEALLQSQNQSPYWYLRDTRHAAGQDLDDVTVSTPISSLDHPEIRMGELPSLTRNLQKVDFRGAPEQLALVFNNGSAQTRNLVLLKTFVLHPPLLLRPLGQ